MSERPILLQADHLKKWFPVRKGVFSKAAQYVKAVDDVSLVIREGETLGIVGCGKSTLARTMMRLIEPTEGTVLFQGQDLTSADKESLRRMRRDIQIIFQDPYASLNPRQRVSDILAEPFLIHKLGSREAAMKRAEELLDLVGLSQDSMRKFPHEFSGGQRQFHGNRTGPCPTIINDILFFYRKLAQYDGTHLAFGHRHPAAQKAFLRDSRDRKPAVPVID